MNLSKTIDMEGVEFNIEFDFQPEDPPEKNYCGRIIYPGAYAEIERVTKVMQGDIDFTDFFDRYIPEKHVIDELWKASND